MGARKVDEDEKETQKEMKKQQCWVEKNWNRQEEEKESKMEGETLWSVGEVERENQCTSHQGRGKPMRMLMK